MEETRSNTHAASPVNALSLQVMGAQNVNERRGLNGDPIAAFSADRYTSIRLDEIESGEKWYFLYMLLLCLGPRIACLEYVDTSWKTNSVD